jgi:hypothetical protein
MHGDKAIGLLALRRIGNVLRRQYGIPVTLPYRLNELVAQLRADYQER